MRRFLLGGFTAAGLLLGGLAITGATSFAADENHVSTWCETGEKYDGLSGQTFTIPPLPGDAPEGAVWTKLILNGGQTGAPAGNVRSFVVSPVPAVGTVITRPGAEVSNAILCYAVPTEPTVPPTEPTVPPTEPTVPPTEPTVPPTESSVPTSEPTVAPPEAAPSVTVAAAGPVPPAAAPAAAPPAPAQSSLPSTGSSSWGLALTALASLLGGLGLMKLSRRTS